MPTVYARSVKGRCDEEATVLRPSGWQWPGRLGNRRRRMRSLWKTACRRRRRRRLLPGQRRRGWRRRASLPARSTS